MSWWVYLVTDREKWDADGEDYEDAVAEVESHQEGGTYAMGGIGKAELSVTYNYGGSFRDHVEGLKESGLSGLDGQRAGDWIEPMKAAIQALGTERDEEYWADTEGNAGHALSILLGWAKQYPDAMFAVH